MMKTMKWNVRLKALRSLASVTVENQSASEFISDKRRQNGVSTPFVTSEYRQPLKADTIPVSAKLRNSTKWSDKLKGMRPLPGYTNENQYTTEMGTAKGCQNQLLSPFSTNESVHISKPGQDREEDFDAREERIAIMMYDGGLSEDEAERQLEASGFIEYAERCTLYESC